MLPMTDERYDHHFAASSKCFCASANFLAFIRVVFAKCDVDDDVAAILGEPRVSALFVQCNYKNVQFCSGCNVCCGVDRKGVYDSSGSELAD